MTTVTITEVERPITRSLSTVEVTRTTVTRTITRSSSAYTPSSFAFDGSSMTGSDGDASRTYTHTVSIPSNSRVYLGSIAGGLYRLDATMWSSAGTVLTVVSPVYDTDRIVVDS